jgi:hypothetical protein
MAVAVQVYQRGLSIRTTLLVPEYSSFDIQDDSHVSDVLAQLGDRRQGQCIPFYILWNIVVAEISSDPSQQATDLTKHAVNMQPKAGQSVSAFIYEMDYIFNVLLNLGVPAQPSLKYSIAAEGFAHGCQEPDSIGYFYTRQTFRHTTRQCCFRPIATNKSILYPIIALSHPP